MNMKLIPAILAAALSLSACSWFAPPTEIDAPMTDTTGRVVATATRPPLAIPTATPVVVVVTAVTLPTPDPIVVKEVVTVTLPTPDPIVVTVTVPTTVTLVNTVTVSTLLTPTAAGRFNPSLGLKYIHPAAPANGSCVGLVDWDQYPSCILQRVQNLELTGPNAVVMIQKLGAAKGAPSFEGTTLSVPDAQAMFVWCPSGATLPSDVAQPLRGTRGAQWGENVFIAAVSSQRTIMSKTGNNCWGVFVQ